MSQDSPTLHTHELVEDCENVWEAQKSGAPRTRAQLEGERRSELADLCSKQGGEHLSSYWACQQGVVPECALGFSCSGQPQVHSFPERQLCSTCSQVHIWSHRKFITAEQTELQGDAGERGLTRACRKLALIDTCSAEKGCWRGAPLLECLLLFLGTVPSTVRCLSATASCSSSFKASVYTYTHTCT